MGSGDDEQRPPAADADDESTATSSTAGADLLSSLGRREFALIGVVVVLLAAAVLGLGSGGGSTTAGGGAPASATATPTASTNGTAATPAITMQVRSIDSCGSRCRDVTVALSNEGETAARDVRVTTTITTDGSLVWEGQSDVGRLPAGETVTRTRTVEVGYLDAARIEANDGIVRIETTVRTANGTKTFAEQRDVS